ncbi:MAG: hypothetical protein BAJALOKI3v1_430006 [Promethearchaeota archaeon]|nr:MAG: hypothetical protein BAJALOKI3v1_430006 [Candidatus Lokiarchaeota archaeon]
MVERVIGSVSPQVLLDNIHPSHIDEFLTPFNNYIEDLSIENRLNVNIRRKPNDKINPILRLAESKDANVIADIVKEDYEGTYPYKEMEDPEEIAKMIQRGNHKFFLFLDGSGKVMGSTCYVLDFKEKKGYVRSFVVRKDSLGLMDAKKAYVGSFLQVLKKYNGRILLWWGEARTADVKSQYINRLCSLRPIALMPNKDRFYNNIESDVLIISYNNNLFRRYRSNKKPRIIPCVFGPYSFSRKRYGLESPIIIKFQNKLNPKKLCKKTNKVIVQKKIDKFGYNHYNLKMKDSSSYLKFTYTPTVQNFEKTEYKVKNPFELTILIDKFKFLANKLNVRYSEVYVNGYNAIHQQIFYDNGFFPRGYIPAWRLNKENGFFEDYILFNKYNEKINKINLIQEGRELLRFI